MMCWNLKFFDTGEWQVIEERLRDRLEQGIVDNPDRGSLFAALDACPYETTKVAILGQDPYPSKDLATGIAFDIPKEQTKFPPTLINIFKEYCSDLGYPFPSSGSLLPWCKQGVLLWNVIPTCENGLPASHRNWWEWYYLTQEIVEKLNAKKCLVVSLGSFARSFCDTVPEGLFLSWSHPSPLAAYRGNRPFLGSRFFSTINSKLSEPINWRLDDDQQSTDASRKAVPRTHYPLGEVLLR